jgi:hypothetical protein
MIRKLIPLIVVVGLAACSTPGSQSTTPISSSPSRETNDAPFNRPGSATCNAQAVQNLVGQKYSSAHDGDLRAGASVTQLRILRPGQVMTMEYNPSRLNVILEKNDVISALRCG